MELRYLKTFQKVAEMRSFSRAAEVLHFAQSTISSQIKALEEELKIPLFDRMGKHVTLTDAGEFLLERARRLLAIEQETLEELTRRSEPQGLLTIRIPQTIATCLMPPVLARFRESFPRVRVAFIGCAFSVEHELRTGLIDVAFLMAESILSENLHIEYLQTQPLFLVGCRNHPLASKSALRLEDLQGQSLLLSTTDCSYRRDFERLLAKERIVPGVVLEFSSVETIKRCVEEGIGISLLPAPAVRNEIADGRLVVLDHTEDHPLETAVLLVYHKDKWISPALEAFMDMVRESLGSG